MKTLKHALLTAATLSLGLAGAASAETFNGNGASGFGGAVGAGTLTVTQTASNINFTFTSPNAFNGNDLVLYIDSNAGGVNNNSTLTDVQDGGRRAISGLSSGPRSLVTFVPGFGADYAISFEPGFAGLFDLSTPANFGYLGSGGLTGSGNGPFSFSFPKSALGIDGSDTSFAIEGTLISTSGYRSNETIGLSVTVPDLANPGAAPNAGDGGTQTFLSAGVVAVPEPTTLGLLAGASILALRRRK